MSASNLLLSGRVSPGRSFGVALTLAVLVGGCSGPLRTDYEKVQETRANYIAANPSLGEATKAAIRSGELRVGMTPDEVAAAWGRPAYVNRFENGRKVEWLFGCDYPHFCTYQVIGRFRTTEVFYHSRAYFYDGRLTEWRQV
jgi:hypothetical protein